MTTSPQTIGQRLAQLRQAKGLTVYALAQQAGVNRGYLAEVERDEKVPSWAIVAAIAAVLGADLGDFAGLTPPTANTGKAPPRA